MYSRRQFLKSIPVVLSFGVNPNVESSSYKSGDIAPSNNVELSANLILSAEAILLKQKHFQITGEGHSHSVVLNSEAWSRIEREGKVVVRSEIGGGKYPHSHWVLVKTHTIGPNTNK